MNSCYIMYIWITSVLLCPDVKQAQLVSFQYVQLQIWVRWHSYSLHIYQGDRSGQELHGGEGEMLPGYAFGGVDDAIHIEYSTPLANTDQLIVRDHTHTGASKPEITYSLISEFAYLQ